MFYTFNQNNSGGRFTYDAIRGITHYVIVEADSKAEAVNYAESIGLYFDGAGDCECCGDRWHEPYDEGSETPVVYDKPVETYNFQQYKWIEGPECFVHYKDGSFKGFGE